MSGFSRLLEAGGVTDEELFRHLIFFEKQAGISSSVGLEGMWTRNTDRERIKQEFLNRQFISEKGLEALSNALINIGREEAEHRFFAKERG